MYFIENIRLAFSAIIANKMRSILTMLGIIIGISAVITITTIGTSLQKTLENTFDSVGASTIGIYYYAKAGTTEDGNAVAFRPILEEDYMTDEMFDELEEKYPGKFLVSRSEDCGSGTLINSKEKKVTVNVLGITAGYLKSQKIYKLLSGRNINDVDNKGKKHCIMVSDIFVKQYFGENANPLGQDISIDIEGLCNENFTIIGVYQYPDILKMYDSPGIGDMDRVTHAFIPFNTGQKIAGKQDSISSYAEFILSGGEYDRPEAVNELQDFFDEQYKSNRYYGVEVEDYQAYLSDYTKILNVVTVAISIIAAISLLVGGIGVMNIMLVSITERTREIGIRKALGAKNGSIRTQFITEAVILCLVGGLIGVATGMLNGIIIGKIAEYILKSDTETSQLISLTISPSIPAIIISLGFSMLIGVFFGSYPADKAAKMNPIDSLRYD